jgi:predicted nucleic acid-binding protein
LSFLVDTSTISELRKPRPIAPIQQWWQTTPGAELYLSVVTVHEIRFGIEICPLAAKRQDLQSWLEKFVLPGFSGRLLAVDLAVAEEAARIAAAARKTGNTPELADALIAATARVHGLVVATLNQKHFKPLGVPLVTF